MRVAIVLWSGAYGGAETWSLALAEALSKRATAGVVVVGNPEPLCDRLRGKEIRLEALRLRRGRDVLAHAASFASHVRGIGADASILPSGGYLAAALRLGGYRGRVLAVEHGDLLQRPRLNAMRRTVRSLDALSGSWAVDALVAPSDYMLREMCRHVGDRTVRRIYLGVDVDSGAPKQEFADDTTLTVGFAGRLIPGKGLEVLLEAVSRTTCPDVRVEVAGDGPERGRLEAEAMRLGISDKVRFHGWVGDLPAFWRRCAIAVVPSREWIESFGMVAVEAMAQGLPVIAARNGGLAEVVSEGETGALFDVGDSEALGRLISSYAGDPGLRRRQSVLARERVRTRFNIDRCAQEFLELVRGLSDHQGERAAMTGKA
ncbi:MAG TPA: glycosyltransferase family 4 protein [Candidatus Binatia bacterium]|nr:glycosyltransferase family 4 protein [Candidatus Binatia bacterium]